MGLASPGLVALVGHRCRHPVAVEDCPEDHQVLVASVACLAVSGGHQVGRAYPVLVASVGHRHRHPVILVGYPVDHQVLEASVALLVEQPYQSLAV